MNGTIYILISPGLKDQVRIGKTSRSAAERADELSSTGLPYRFFVAYERQVSDCDAAEREIHEALNNYRVSENREFFNLDLKQAIRWVADVCDDFQPQKGSIYILINPALKDQVKIGKTSRSATERADELSSTGLPYRFFVAYERQVSDCDAAEREIHEALNNYRVSENREFFNLDLQQAIRWVADVCDDFQPE